MYLHIGSECMTSCDFCMKTYTKSRQARQIKYETSLLAWVQDIYPLKKFKIFKFMVVVFEKLCYCNTQQKSQSECFNNWVMKGQQPNKLLLLPCHSGCGARRIKITYAVFSSHFEVLCLFWHLPFHPSWYKIPLGEWTQTAPRA